MTNRNKAAVACFSMAALCATIMFIVGCTADRLIKVSVPPGIQQELELPSSKVTLREAPHTRERYALEVQQNLETFDGNVDDATILFDMLSLGTQFGLNATKEGAATLPGGSLIVGALTTIGALFTRRPGDKSSNELRKEKERSYAKGAEDLKAQLLSMGVKLGERAAGRAVDKAVDAAVDKVMGDSK